ncbi:MAG: DMT family protein [Helicobacteraceae bacterium]|nr:DMT family protein [Helicobacteraceae bacterium]
MKYLPILLLAISNIFMTYAWYGHIKDLKSSPLFWAILASWGVAFFEYCFMVPANRIGAAEGWTLSQLKTLQEIITILVFVAFAVFYFHEKLTWNYIVGFALIALAGFFVFGVTPQKG